MRKQEKTSPRRRLTWKRLLLALALLFVLLEFCLRFFFGFAHPLLYQSDPQCGYLSKPSQDILRFRSHNYINAHSMRSPEFTLPKPPDRFRILFLGDSVTFGTTYVPQDRIFTSQLANALPSTLHHPLEVLNFSTGGWAPENEVKALLSRGTFQSDLVINVWNTDDLDQPFVPFPGGSAFPIDNPWTALGEIWSRYLLPRISGESTADPGSLPYALSPDAPRVAAHNLDLLSQARQFTIQSGAAFSLVLVPSGPAYQSASRGKMLANLHAWARDHNVPFLDLSETFNHDSWDALTFDDIHLRPHGNDVVAHEIVIHWAELAPAPASSSTRP
jgi:hypothetical protein